MLLLDRPQLKGCGRVFVAAEWQQGCSHSSIDIRESRYDNRPTTLNRGAVKAMKRSSVQEVDSLVWDVGLEAGLVSPSIQRVIEASDLRSADAALSHAQRNAFARIAFLARLLGRLQIFQVLSGDRRQTPR